MSTNENPPTTYTIQNCSFDMKPSKKSETLYELACAIRALAEGLKYEDKVYGIYIDSGEAPKVHDDFEEDL